MSSIGACGERFRFTRPDDAIGGCVDSGRHLVERPAGVDHGESGRIGDGKRESDACWALAELTTADRYYVVRAIQLPNEPEIIRVRAESR